MQDRHEKLQAKEPEARGQATTSHHVSGGRAVPVGNSPTGLPAMLPKLPIGGRISAKPTDPATEVPSQGTKHTLDVADDADGVVEISDNNEVARPPKKKKKKKNKSKDRSKDETPLLEAQDDGVCPSTSAAEPEVATEEPVPVPELPRKRKRKRMQI